MERMMKLRPHQELARQFLHRDRNRLLADEQRVGKTAPALTAAIDLQLSPVLIVCPVSVQYVWERECEAWGVPGTIGICDPSADVCIVPYSKIVSGVLAAALRRRNWALLILDESHYAKNFGAQRTRAVYGIPNGRGLDQHQCLVHHAERVWCLTGTPIPHDPSDLFPMLRALFPHVLQGQPGVYPDVTSYPDFEVRYVKTYPKKVSPWRTIKIKSGGRNEGELGRRLGPNMLRRKQKDIGIRPSDHSLLPLEIKPSDRRLIEEDMQLEKVLAAADAGLPLHDLVTARVRHLTGDIKAHAVVSAAKDYFEDTQDKLVIAYWHRSVGDTLEAGLARLNPLRVDGSTLHRTRGQLIDRFRDDPKARVFLAQIEAAGEGIDLSPAPELWFAESVFSPRLMAQMAARISNINQTRQTLVRVCTLAGSIDEAIQRALLRLYTTIKTVLED
jgi:SNF2 family DNA or RNA helicase